jgi:agmatine/peptidylarginine deiminase
MKKFLLFLLLVITFSPGILSQDLPHYMTDEEKILWENYTPFVNPNFSTPPPVPVRTMAEWEELQAIMITWTSQQSILREIVRNAQSECRVYIVCSDSNSVKSYLSSGGVQINNIGFLIYPYNSIWIRDYGPWSVYAEGSDSLYIVDWVYNRPRPNDDNIPLLFANSMNIPIFQTTVEPYRLVHTGGNFMVDGLGTGFSSHLILDENPGKTEAQIDEIMDLFMGINRYIKMENLPYDQIHHIDMHMKLLDEETLLVGQYPPGVADGPQIEANLQYVLTNFLTPYGKPYRVIRIPMPPHNGQYPPSGNYRTYTNSIIVNKTVIVPTYELQYDTTALRIYREAMPGYNIVGINCNAIIPSLGAIHCIVKEVGTDNPLFISHSRIRDTLITNSPIEIKALIKNQSGISQAGLYWTTDTTQGYSQIQMSLLSGDTLVGNIPAQPNSAEVFYYISATSVNGKTSTKPLTAPQGYYKFYVDVPVPVELASFNSSVSGNSVTLRWLTSSEINNQGFEVERKVLSPQASPGNTVFEKAGFVSGYGTTTEIKSYSFIDTGIENGSYLYRLKQLDFDGSFKYYNLAEVIEIMTPDRFELAQNYPNPFNPATKIEFSLPEDFNNVKLTIFNPLGQKVAELVNSKLEAGQHSYQWDASNIASGLYIYQLQTNKFTATKKMILLK